MTLEAWTWFGTAVVLLGFLVVALSEMVRRAPQHARQAPTSKPGEALGVKADGSRVLLLRDYRKGSVCLPEDVVLLVLGRDNGGVQ